MKTPKKLNKTIADTINDNNPMSSLKAKLKATDSEIQNYVTALVAENLKLQKQIGKLQAENVTLYNQIKILEEEKSKPEIILEYHIPSPTNKND